MREGETDPAWARRLKDRCTQRRGGERIARWIAPRAVEKRRVGGRSLGGLDDSSNDNAMSVEARSAG